MNDLLKLCIAIFLTLPHLLEGQYDGNCPGYFPCNTGAQVRWMSVRSDSEGQVSQEIETLQITSMTNSSSQYNRTLSMTAFSGGSGSFSQQGEVNFNAERYLMGPDFFLPRPSPTLSDLLTPPTITYTGAGCAFPNNLNISNLPDCTTMKIVVESAARPQSSNPFLDGSMRFECQISYNERKVLDPNHVLEVNGVNIQCAVIQEKRTLISTNSDTLFEVSWLAKGVGKIKSVYFRNDPGGNWNSTSGSIGSRIAIIF